MSLSKRQFKRLVKQVAIKSSLSRKTTMELLNQGYSFTEDLNGTIKWSHPAPCFGTQTLEAYKQSMRESNE